MSKKTFCELVGYDECFDMPGGGLVNLDIYKRACELPDTNLIVILGEGTFHQMHSGVITNVTEKKTLLLWKEFENQYIEIRKNNYSRPDKTPAYIGHIPPELLKFIRDSAKNALNAPRKHKLRSFFDKIKNLGSLWSL